MRSKADETLVIVETLICPLQTSQNQNVLLLTSKCAMQHKQKHKHTNKKKKKIDIRRQRRLRRDLNGFRVKQSPGKLSCKFKFYE